MTYPPTPEHDKLSETMKLSEFTQRLGEALDLGAENYQGKRYMLVLHMTDEDHESLVSDLQEAGDAWGESWIEAHESVVHLERALADLMGVDYEALMDEKDAILEYVRSQPQ